MITQKIEKYSYPVYRTPAYFPHNQPSFTPHPNAPYAPLAPMGKLEFAQYLAGLSFKSGDFVVYKTIAQSSSYTEWQCSYVVSIQEIHHLIGNWGTNATGPHCLELVSYMSSQNNKLGKSFTAGDRSYRKVEPGQVAKIFRDAVYAHFNHKSVSVEVEAPSLVLVETKI